MIETLREKPVFAEDSHITLRNLRESDRVGYLQTLRSVSPFPELYDIEGFEEDFWEKTMSEPRVAVLAAERKSDGTYVGHGMVKWKSGALTVEPGIDRTGNHRADAGEGIPVVAAREAAAASKAAAYDPAVCPLTLEVGMDVRAEFQDQGYGTEILTLMLRELRERFPGALILARTYSDNHRCRHILRQLGGIPVGQEPTEKGEGLCIEVYEM